MKNVKPTFKIMKKTSVLKANVLKMFAGWQGADLRKWFSDFVGQVAYKNKYMFRIINAC